MAFSWFPDFCPGVAFNESAPGVLEARGGCAIEIDKASGAVRMVAMCPHHQGVKDQHGLTDTQLFDAILASSVMKEQARTALQNVLGELVECRTNPDGSFTMLVKAGADIAALTARVNARLATIDKPLGVSTVTVE